MAVAEYLALLNGVPEASSYVDNFDLAAGVADTVTVPTGAVIAVFSANTDFLIRRGGTATLITADVEDGTGSILNPTMRRFPPSVTSFSIISPLGGDVSIEWYKG